MRVTCRLLSLFLSLTLALPNSALAMRNLEPAESGLEEDLSTALNDSPPSTLGSSPTAGLEEGWPERVRKLYGIWSRFPGDLLRGVKASGIGKLHRDELKALGISGEAFGRLIGEPFQGSHISKRDQRYGRLMMGVFILQAIWQTHVDKIPTNVHSVVTTLFLMEEMDRFPQEVRAIVDKLSVDVPLMEDFAGRLLRLLKIPAAGLEEVSKEEAARVLGILDAHFKKEGSFRPDNSKVQLMPYGFSNRVYRIERSDGQVLVGFKMQPILRFPALDRNHFRFEQKQDAALAAGVLPNNWKRLSFLDRREVKSKFYRDEQGDYWRFMPYVEERVIQTTDEIPADRRLAAMKRFGKLLVQFRQMTEMEVGGTLEDTLPNHQNTTYHLDFYDRVLAGENVDPPMSEPGVLPLVSIQKDRLEGSDEHGDFAARNGAFQEKVAQYRTILRSAMGRLRRVVVHGDPRMNNIFWEINQAGEWIPAALGDLDYLQSGHELLDLSDAVRSLAFMGAERADPENLVIFRDVVEALIEGWLEGIEAAYGKEERKRLESFAYLSVPAIHFTLAIRFYDSFLTGDSHFERLTRYGKKVSDPGRFLRFAEVQMAQAEAFMREFSDKPGMAKLAQWAGGLEEVPAVLDAGALDTLAASRQFIFLGVHPDDIEQQLGGLVRQMAARGAPITLGVLTTGAGIGVGDYAGTEVGVRAEFIRQIHGWSAARAVTLEEKEAQRQQEAREGARRLGVAPEALTFFRFGAGDTRTESLDETLGDAARQQLVEFLTRRQAEGARPLTVVYHDAQSDPHPAHFKSAELLNAALRQAAEQMGQPIDVWAGGLKAEDGRATQRLPLTEADQEAKRQALAAHQTQVLHYEAKRREFGAETMHEWMDRVGAASGAERQQLPPAAPFVERYQRLQIVPAAGLEEGIRWETAESLRGMDDASAKELAAEVGATGAAGAVLLPRALVKSARPEQLQIDVYGHESVEYDALMALGVSIVDTPYNYLPQVADQAREKIAGIKPGQPAVVAIDIAFEGSLGNILPEEYPLTLLIEPDSWQPNALRQKALAALITQAALHPQDRRLRNLIIKLTSDSARAVTLQGTEYVAVLISA